MHRQQEFNKTQIYKALSSHKHNRKPTNHRIVSHSPTKPGMVVGYWSMVHEHRALYYNRYITRI
jgi:hypothetical protein